MASKEELKELMAKQAELVASGIEGMPERAGGGWEFRSFSSLFGPDGRPLEKTASSLTLIDNTFHYYVDLGVIEATIAGMKISFPAAVDMTGVEIGVTELGARWQTVKNGPNAGTRQRVLFGSANLGRFGQQVARLGTYFDRQFELLDVPYGDERLARFINSVPIVAFQRMQANPEVIGMDDKDASQTVYKYFKDKAGWENIMDPERKGPQSEGIWRLGPPISNPMKFGRSQTIARATEAHPIKMLGLASNPSTDGTGFTNFVDAWIRNLDDAAKRWAVAFPSQNADEMRRATQLQGVWTGINSELNDKGEVIIVNREFPARAQIRRIETLDAAEPLFNGAGIQVGSVPIPGVGWDIIPLVSGQPGQVGEEQVKA